MLTVADILAIDRLRLTPAAGGDGLGRRVRSAHTSELEDPTPWLSGGELLLTTGQPLGRDPGGYVERLAGHGLAGLGLGLGFGLDEMPPDARAAAARRGFPVFTIPYEVPFLAISEAVFTRLAEGRTATLERMTALILEQRPMDELLDELAALTGAELALLDAEGGELAATAGISSRDSEVTRLPVVTGDGDRTQLLARGGDRHLVHHAQTVLAVELLRRRSVADTERRLAGDLVEAALSGEVGARDLHRRAAAFGLDGAHPLSFVVLRPQDGPAALARLAEDAAGHGPASVRDGGVVVLIEAADDDAAERRARGLLEATGAAAAGVGRIRSDPGELPGCYDEALYAVEARPPNGHPAVATFRDLGSLQLLLSLRGERGVELYCESLLGALTDHDRRHGSALLPSLRAYIEANGRWADAAAALDVHRHTLRYRVRKIEELTGRDLSDARDRLELWLALRAHEMQGRRAPVNGGGSAADGLAHPVQPRA